MFVRVSCFFFFTSVRYYPTESNIIHILNENKKPYQHYTEADLGRDNGDGLQNSYTEVYDVSTSCSGVDEITTKGLDAFALLVEAWDVDPRKDLEVCVDAQLIQASAYAYLFHGNGKVKKRET